LSYLSSIETIVWRTSSGGAPIIHLVVAGCDFGNRKGETVDRGIGWCVAPCSGNCQFKLEILQENRECSPTQGTKHIVVDIHIIDIAIAER
jgi:hypothetical protein